MSTKYPYGYIPKIQYWLEQYSQAITAGTYGRATQCLGKLNYFTGKQKALIGSI